MVRSVETTQAAKARSSSPLTLGCKMGEEIRQQPDTYRRILMEGRGSIVHVAKAIGRYQPRFVLLAARGSSDHAALYGKYLVETRLRLPAGLISPSTFTLYHSQPRLDEVLFIAVSQSGSSPDLIVAAEAARGAGAMTVAITNDSSSNLAGVAEHQLSMLSGPEESVAATKTCTAAMLVLLLMLESSTVRGWPDEAIDLPNRAASVLSDLEPAVGLMAEDLLDTHRMLVTSRGYNLSVARESALKLTEAALIPAFSYSTADLMHGPVAMVDTGFPVIAIIPEGPAGKAMAPALQTLIGRGAGIYTVGSDQGAASSRRHLDTGSIPDFLSPLLNLLPLQMLAREAGVRRGRDPDRPAGLAKVTYTI